MRRKNLLFAVVAASIILGIISLYDVFFPRARCEFGFLAQKSAYSGEKFLRCSNIDQQIQGLSGVVDEASDTPGWRIYRPSRPDRPGTIQLTIAKDRDTAFFYPRVSGRDSSVVLGEPTDNIVREWVVVRGRDVAWTPISRRYFVNLACIGRAEAAGEPVKIEIVLNGPWAQLWHQDGTVLF
jgi:hypothetical protein